MGKKFVGLDGLKHFWKQAKIWIGGRITGEVTARIAEVVADAPEDLDTLKEIADWISTHADSASEMNTQINTNKSDIAALQTSVAGKADTEHTHTKSEITDFPTSLKNPNALTVNGKTYDGSSAVNAGVQTVANGGTGATDAAGGFNTLADGVRDSTTPADNEKMLLKPSGTWYKTTCLDFWNYIKGKISSVLGLTKDNYGGKASTAGTADYAHNMYSQTFDLSSLDKTKFYPLVCASWTNFAEVAIFSESRLANDEYNQNRIHFDISTQGWSDLPCTLNIREYACYDNNELTIGCIGRGQRYGAWAIWLRGGIRYQCFTRNCSLSLKTSDFTYGDETYTVGTNHYGRANSYVDTWFTPQSTIRDGAYSSRRITAEIKANYRLVIPIGAPSFLEDGCIWIER